MSTPTYPLTWDESGKKLYETGVRHGVLYPMNADGEYKPGVAWNGLTAITEQPSGAESNPLYADDIKYLDIRSAEEFGATIEAYTYPDEWAECDGSARLADGAISIGQQSRGTFGLSYRTVLGNDVKLDQYGYKLHLIYGATAAPSERGYQTINDSPEAISFSWEVTTSPVTMKNYNGKEMKPTSCITIDSTKCTTAEAKAALKSLEDALYGTDSTPPYLPLPDQVATFFGLTADL